MRPGTMIFLNPFFTDLIILSINFCIVFRLKFRAIILFLKVLSLRADEYTSNQVYSFLLSCWMDSVLQLLP